MLTDIQADSCSTSGALLRMRAQIAPHIYFCTPIAFQNLEGNCSANGTSTTIPITCVPRRILVAPKALLAV